MSEPDDPVDVEVFSPEVSSSSQSPGSHSGDSEQFHSNTSDDG